MKITIITLFPEIFSPLLNFSILKRAQQKGLVEFDIINLRDFGEGPHRIVDDRPYGGGPGMILKADVLSKSLKSINQWGSGRTILTSASGITFTQKKAREFVKLEHIIIISGHYEGVDQRFIDKYVDEEISIGDFILTGGELPALVIADAVTRLIPGVLEKAEATTDESFEQGLLEYPHFTRPEDFEGAKVPEILLSGNHKEIARWRKKQSELKTIRLRPDLGSGKRV